MDKISILERIVEEGGSCSWARASTCKVCPLGKSTNADGTRYISCVVAINIEGLSEKEADAKYKDAATRKLAEILLEAVIQAPVAE
jgi:hypothetical protein